MISIQEQIQRFDGDTAILIPFPKSGSFPTVHQDQCKGCGLCVAHCPKNVLKISDQINSLGYAPAEVSSGECSGCAICFYICPEPGAVSVCRKKRVVQVPKRVRPAV